MTHVQSSVLGHFHTLTASWLPAVCSTAVLKQRAVGGSMSNGSHRVGIRGWEEFTLYLPGGKATYVGC